MECVPVLFRCLYVKLLVYTVQHVYVIALIKLEVPVCWTL